MQAKEYLNQANKLNERIRDKQERLASLQELAYSIGAVDYSKDRVQGGSLPDAPYANTLVNAIAYEEELKKDLIRLQSLRIEIGQAIDTVSNTNHYLVLSKKYVFGKSWKQIAREMNYSISHCKALCKEAERNFQVPNQNIIPNNTF